MAKPRVAVIDAETDPFKHGETIEPFCWGFYDGDIYIDFWGPDCTNQLIQYLLSRHDKLIIYAHNGGKFDFYYLIDFITNPLKIINGRIVSAALGHHRLRDSFAIIPVPLAAYQKDTIDYDKFTKAARDKNKKEILRYLYSDCMYLYSLVFAFVERFGAKLTIGSTAIKEIEKLHPFARMNDVHDAIYRPYYYGGRCECFEAGVLPGNWRVYDVNSMYPHVMRGRDHCSGKQYFVAHNATALLNPRGEFIHDPHKPYFARIVAQSTGALPWRHDDGSLVFPIGGIREYNATSHEIQTALRHRLLKIISVESLHVCLNPINFSRFVDTYYAEKVAAKKVGDKISEMFSKFLLNSGYGKFGTNPANFKDWKIVRVGDPNPGMEWEFHSQVYDCEIYSKQTPADYWQYFDVATAASITGASRAVLLDAMPYATRMAYCDTDSIICEDLALPEDPHTLGGWKLEARGDRLLIGGKKLYALTNGGAPIDDSGKLEKIASKGIRATVAQIMDICNGKNFTYNNPAPSFSLTRGVRYISRTVSYNARIES